MKTQPTARRLANRNHRGFALIITLTLMVLMTIIALGLFSLSSVSLRAASQSKAQEMAKANARMALNIAIGELQKYAGPDQRITATGSIMDDATTPTPNEMANIAGVWESWKIDPNSPPGAADYKKNGTRKGAPLNNSSPNDGNFCKWLVSTEDPAATDNVDFVKNPSIQNKAILLPEISSGSTNRPEIYAGIVPIKETSNGKESGGYAWAVMDEGVKVRMDTGYTPISSNKLGNLSMSLGTGVRADVSKIPALKNIDWGAADLTKSTSLGKAITFDSSALFNESLNGSKDASFKALFNDITVYSMGLFTNVADGGLKKDMNAVLNASSLPSGYTGSANQSIYKKELAFSTNESDSTSSQAGTGIIDPRWASLRTFSTYYQSSSEFPTSGLFVPRLPINWLTPTAKPATATTLTSLQKAPPINDSPVIMPIILKAQIFFSVVAFESTNSRRPPNWTAARPCAVHLFYTPVLTLYNPYNMAMDLGKTPIEVEINNPPMSVGISVSGDTAGVIVPFQNCFQGAGTLGNNKKFRLKMPAEFTLAPGEITVVSPSIASGRTYNDDRATYESRTFVDTVDGATKASNSLTMRGIEFIRGFNGVTVGYCLDSPKGTSPNGSTTLWATSNDTIDVQFRAASFSDSKTSASLSDQLGPDGNKYAMTYIFPPPGVFSMVMSSKSAPKDPQGTNIYSSINFDYSGSKSGAFMDGLEKALKISTYKFPMGAPLKIESILGNPLKGIASYPPNGCFAVICATAKTSLANEDADGDTREDNGRYTSKPWSFNSPVSSFLYQKIGPGSQISPAQFAYDLDVFPLDSAAGYGPDKYLELSNGGKQGYGLVGLKAGQGAKFGTYYEIPQAPLQTMPELNNANLAGGHSVARFAYPIGNSWAHPMIPPNLIQTADTSGAPGASKLYDHSFLLNLALYDKYYFSGLTERSGSFMDSMSTKDVVGKFVDSFSNTSSSASTNPLIDKRISLWLPSGETATSSKTILAQSPTSNNEGVLGKASSFQVMKGAFNVNSTSVEAWKAMLSSIHTTGAKINPSQGTNSNLSAQSKNTALFSRFRMPNSNIDKSFESSLQSPREITDTQLENLAKFIVEEVKTRGPFLSMAEFVNRNIGAGTSDLVEKGALQAAIDKTDINSTASTGYNIGNQHVSGNSYININAAKGRTDQGSPNNLTQADLLSALGNAATVRSDTFRIRSYGEAKDSFGKVIARAWCEAIIQRTPDYVSMDNPSYDPYTSLKQNSPNKIFGRKMIVSGFRWISPDELTNQIQ